MHPAREPLAPARGDGDNVQPAFAFEDDLGVVGGPGRVCLVRAVARDLLRLGPVRAEFEQVGRAIPIGGGARKDDSSGRGLGRIQVVSRTHRKRPPPGPVCVHHGNGGSSAR